MATPSTAFKKGEKRPNQGKRGPNKVTKQLKEMILGALDDAGGQKYLQERAKDPKTQAAFLTLLGKVLPSDMRISDPDGKPLQAVPPVLNVTIAAKK